MQDFGCVIRHLCCTTLLTLFKHCASAADLADGYIISTASGHMHPAFPVCGEKSCLRRHFFLEDTAKRLQLSYQQYCLRPLACGWQQLAFRQEAACCVPS